MGTLKRKAIRCIESIINSTIGQSDIPRNTELLSIGRAQAAYGRRGYIDVQLSIQDRLRHEIKIGSTGTGKSVSELGDRIHDLRTNQPFLLLDCHDSVDKLLRIIAREVLAKRLSDSVVESTCLIAPGKRDWTVCINPYECQSPSDAPYQIGPIIEVIRVLWGDVLGPQTLQFTRYLLILMAERNIALTESVRLLDDSVKLRAHAINVLHAETREYFLNRFLAWSPRKRAQVAEAFLNKIGEFLAHPGIAAMLGLSKSDLDFRQAMDKGKTILISLDKAQLFGSVNLLASLILVSLRQATFSRGDLPEHERRPYFVIVEEFSSFASSVTIEPFLNESRKFGVGLVLIAQTLASVHGSLLSSLRTNCYTQLYFRLSPEDARVASAGLSGEERELISGQLVSLPIGTAVMIQSGGMPKRLTIPNLTIPEDMSAREEEIIETIRHNIGHQVPVTSTRPLIVKDTQKQTISDMGEPTPASTTDNPRDMIKLKGDDTSVSEEHLIDGDA